MEQNEMWKNVMVVIILAILITFASTSSAAVHVENVASGLQGFARGERWIPIVFRLVNAGNDFRGILEVNKGDSFFRKSIDLAAQSAKEVEIFVYYSAYYGPLEYRILDEEGSKIKEDRLQVTTLNSKDNLVLVISDGDYNHQFLNGVPNPWGGKTFVSYLKSDQLYSDWIAYSTADVIVLGSLPIEKISTHEWKAVLQYVASGGLLVCSSATNLQVLEHAQLRHVLPTFSKEYSLISRGDFLSSSLPSTLPLSPISTEVALPVQKMVLRPCDILLLRDSDGIVLSSSSPYYKGNIIYFTFDYMRLPEEIRVHFASVWNDLLFPSFAGPPPFGLPFRQRLDENPRVQKFLYDIPGLRLPEAKWFALFFFIYICAIGPLQLLLLKLLKRTYLLWITFPLLILLFSLTSFGYSRVRQTDLKLTQVEVQ
jgi:hypothetical protein